MLKGEAIGYNLRWKIGIFWHVFLYVCLIMLLSLIEIRYLLLIINWLIHFVLKNWIKSISCMLFENDAFYCLVLQCVRSFMTLTGLLTILIKSR